MTTTKSTISTLALITSTALTACNFGGLAVDEEPNDTQFGDDDIDGGTGDGPPQDPEEVVDHGIAQFCVERSGANAAYDYAEHAKHERWYQPVTRQYVSWLDLTDKPSPVIVPPACPHGWNLTDIATADANERGGSPSCLNSGYHLQLPWIGTSDYLDPGDLQWPYSKDLIIGTIGNPPSSGRHTWFAPMCCGFQPTDAEFDDDDWELIQASNPETHFDTPHADCMSYVAAIGVQSHAAGYDPLYNGIEMLEREMKYSTCVTGRKYPANQSVTLGIYKVGKTVNYHPARLTESYPANLNYDWVASLGLVGWDDFAAFGDTIDAVIKALLQVLYLPPDDFQHARYAAGGGCHFPVAIRWSSSVGDFAARLTCPIGYYANFPNFVEQEVIDDGVIGRCILDGYDHGDAGFSAGDQVLNAHPGHDRYYAVHDIERLSSALSESVEFGGVTNELAEMVVGEDGDQVLLEGDAIAWWSSPWDGDPKPIGEALAGTIGYDVDEFADATGMTVDEAERFIDDQETIRPLGDIFDGLPDNLARRPNVTLRSHRTFRMRVKRQTERGTEVMFLHFTAPAQ